MDQRWFFDPSDPKAENRIYRTAKHMEFIETLKKKGTYRDQDSDMVKTVSDA